MPHPEYIHLSWTAPSNKGNVIVRRGVVRGRGSRDTGTGEDCVLKKKRKRFKGSRRKLTIAKSVLGISDGK